MQICVASILVLHAIKCPRDVLKAVSLLVEPILEVAHWEAFQSASPAVWTLTSGTNFIANKDVMWMPLNTSQQIEP